MAGAVLRVPRPPAGDPLEAFSEDEVRACLAYAKPRQRWSLVAVAANLLVLAALAASGPGRSLVREVAGLAGGWAPGRAALATAVVVVAEALVGLPFAVRAFRQDIRAGLATQGLGGFLLDWLKGRTVGLVLTVVPVCGLILAARWPLPGWPWTAAMAAAVLVVALGLLGPVLIEPLFNRFTPLAPGPVRGRVLALAARMGVPVRDVLVSDASRRTTRVNAYVSGLGRTRRVVVYDTLLTGSPATDEAGRADEVALVLAHELAHVRHRDVLWGAVAAAAAAAAAVPLAARILDLGWVADRLGVAGIADPLAAPALVLLVAAAGVLAAPVASAISRWAEARADWAALEATCDPDTAVAVERRLALDNRADLRPNRLLVALFASHPPTMARIAQARLWKARHPGAERVP
jgi:STE24 endopeptidase